MIPNAWAGFDFGLGSDVDMLRKTAGDFAQDRIAPRAAAIDRDNEFPRDLWPEMGALGLSVLAEGVETEQQRVLLRLAGCDEMQGFLFAKPAPAEAIDELLRQGKNARPVEALTA